MEVDRIGHAIPLAYDPVLLAYAAKRGMGIEGCPGSNLASGLIPNTQYLQIRRLLDAEVIYSLNSDDDLFLPDLEETFILCDSEYHFTKEEVTKLQANPWKSRFGSRKNHHKE